MKNILIAASFICILCACGGSDSSGGSTGGTGGTGGGGGGGSTGVVTLSPGNGQVDTSQINNGIVSILFPAATGDQPTVTAVTVAGSNGDGMADLSATSGSSFDITSDSFNVYFPTTGDYVLTVTVSDLGDTPIDKVINISIPTSQQYALSGSVQDGPLNSTVGVRTHVRLYWNPLAAANTQIASVESNASSNGNYQFSNLVGSASYFRVGVDGGTH